jgi:2',3'-cyclic-nucleotide 2'-phosphodiesterase (5'-nucleotidase family)
MRRRFFALACIAASVTASAGCAGTTAGSRNDVASKQLRVIATNDVHGHLFAEPQSFAGGARVGGAAELAAYIERDRAAFTAGPAILLDGGDVMQGTPVSNLLQGRSTVDVFNAMGYSAAAIGNHELDWGQAVLQERMAQARYPWLAANIVVAGSDTTPSWIKPTAIISAGSLRIGIVGLITKEVPQTTQLKNITGLEFREGAAALDRWIPRLRAQNVDFVIVVAHSGGSCDRDGANCHGEMLDWIERAHAKPDLVVAGHTHTVVQTVVAGVPIVEAGSYGNRYNVVDLRRVTRDSIAFAIAPLRTVFADSVKPDASIAALVERYRREAGPQIDRVIATAREDVPRGSGESPMGRLIADGQRFATKSQIAIMNSGGVRGALKAGPITWGNLFQIHPFANRLVVLKLSGANVRGAIEHAVSGSDTQAQVSGLLADFDPSRPAGSRVTSLRLADGTPIHDDSIYTVTVNDFLATGQGDGFTNLGKWIEQTDAGIVDLDALIAYVRHLPVVTAPMDVRLRRVGQ